MTATRGRLAALLVGLLMAATLVVALTAGPAGGQDARTLRIAIPADYGPLSPYAPDSLAAPLGLVLDTLFTTPYAAEPEPLLATSAEPVPGSGNRTWTIELRRGVRWHDGRPFTAQDVKFSFDYYRDGPPNGITHHASLAPILERTEVVGEHTVRTTCAQPCPFLRDVTLAFLPIVAAHQWREVEDPLEFDGTLLGTGPYRLPGRYVPGERYELEANGAYFAGRPSMDRLVLSIIPEPSTALLALASDQVDAVAAAVPPQLIERFVRSSDVRVVQARLWDNAELIFNMDEEPFRSRDFRRAATMAIDRDRILDTVLAGRGITGQAGWPHPESPWSPRARSLPYDPEAARRIFSEIGAAGTEVEILVEQNQPVTERAVQLAAQDLDAAGLRSTVRALDTATTSERKVAGDFDAFVINDSAHGTADPVQSVYSSFEAEAYIGRYDNPEVARLLERAGGSETLEGFRESLFAAYRLLPDDPPLVPLYYPQGNFAVRPAAHDGWRDAPGYGIAHKFSLVDGGLGEPSVTAAVALDPAAGGTGDSGGGPSPLGIAIVAGAAGLGLGAALLRRRRRRGQPAKAEA